MDSLELTRCLLRFDTVNPPGDEAECADFLAGVLEAAGLDCELAPFAPGRGINAIYRAAGGVGRIETLDLGPAHEAFMGPPTVNVGMIRGGLNANSAPDHAEFTIDVRSGPQPSQGDTLEALRRALGAEIDAQPYIALPAVLTRRDDPFLLIVAARAAEASGRSARGRRPRRSSATPQFSSRCSAVRP